MTDNSHYCYASRNNNNMFKRTPDSIFYLNGIHGWGLVLYKYGWGLVLYKYISTDATTYYGFPRKGIRSPQVRFILEAMAP